MNTPKKKQSRWGDVLTYIIFVLFASFIWFGHALESERTTRVPVLIHYTGKPGSIGIGAPGLPDTVLITVRDAGGRLNAYHREDLRLTIDLRSYIHSEKGTIHIHADVLRRSISSLLQSTSSLLETHPDEISCPYYTEQEKSVPVALAGSVTPSAEYQLVGEPVLSRKRMKIYGQDRVLQTIDTLYTEALERTNLSDTMTLHEALAIPEGIRAEQDSVEVQIICERFTEKKFIVPVHAIGVPEGYHIRLFPKEVEVSVRMGMSHFAQVQPKDIQARCVYSPERRDKLDVEIHYTNPYITSAWIYPGVVEFILEQ